MVLCQGNWSETIDAHTGRPNIMLHQRPTMINVLVGPDLLSPLVLSRSLQLTTVTLSS